MNNVGWILMSRGKSAILRLPSSIKSLWGKKDEKSKKENI